jgi:RNA polymerase sigma-70 factor (ECF subfamily)
MKDISQTSERNFYFTLKENDLIMHFKYKDELDIEKIITDFSGYVHKVVENASKKYLNSEDIEELVSDVFLAVWKNQQRLDLDKSIKPYLAGIAGNLIKNRFRNRHIEYDILDYENELTDQISVDILVEQKEVNKSMLEALKEFCEEDYNIFTMYYYGSKKVKEISKVLRISQSKVKTQLHRIRKRLKKFLKEVKI